MTMTKQAAWIAVGALAQAAGAQTFVTFEPGNRHYYAFEAGQPGSARLSAIALHSGYVRGMEMTDERNGWSIVTMSENGSPFGLFRIADGSVSHVADLPFQITSVGGMTFNERGDGFYLALDAPGAGPTLFRMDFTGAWEEVGPILVEDGQTAELVGIAMDPRTGWLYGLDKGNDALVRIDPTRGRSEIVGGIGYHAHGAGGLDFAYVDGEWRLYGMIGDTGIREFNLETGLASGPIAYLPFGANGGLAAVPAPGAALAFLAAGGLTGRRRR